jgi:two-component sensor histidine kinase
VHIIWSEQGEPEIEPAETQGYGSSLVRQALEGPLGGSIRHECAKSGAMVVIEVDADRLAI